MATQKQILGDYILKSLTNGEGHHLEGSFLEMVMEKFTTLASPTSVTSCQGQNIFSVVKWALWIVL